MKQPKKRGGHRPGAGRKAGPDKLTRVDIKLADKHIEKAKILGGGTLTAGIRQALDQCNGGCTLWQCGRSKGHEGPCQPVQTS
jgi:hypothetical protein